MIDAPQTLREWVLAWMATAPLDRTDDADAWASALHCWTCREPVSRHIEPFNRAASRPCCWETMSVYGELIAESLVAAIPAPA